MEDATVEDALVFIDDALLVMSDAVDGADVSTIASETLSAMAALSTIQNDTLTSNKIHPMCQNLIKKNGANCKASLLQT